MKHDLQKLKKIMIDADQEALASFKVAKSDISSFFILPGHLVGRDKQREAILSIVEKAAHRNARSSPVTRKGLYSLSKYK